MTRGVLKNKIVTFYFAPFFKFQKKKYGKKSGYSGVSGKGKNN